MTFQGGRDTLARRINVVGGSGSGTSTLARGLADRLASQSFDADDFYWRPTDPPFHLAREVGERIELLEALVLPRRDWIIAGSLAGWGDAVIPRLTHVILLTLPGPERLERLKAREARRYGLAIARGGVLEVAHGAFMDWARCYDDPGFEGRSRMRHEAWLARLPCPVIRLDASVSAAELANAAEAALAPV